MTVQTADLTADERAEVTPFGELAMQRLMGEGMTEREAFNRISGGPRCTRPGQPMMRDGRYLPHGNPADWKRGTATTTERTDKD